MHWAEENEELFLKSDPEEKKTHHNKQIINIPFKEVTIFPERVHTFPLPVQVNLDYHQQV